MPGRRVFRFLSLCVLAWSALPALAQPLVVGVSRSSLSLPLFVADSQGYFAAEGVQVRLRECLGGQRCIKLVFDGEVQVGTASELPVMFNAFDRRDFAVIATFVSSDRDIKLVARKSAGITGPRDLTGKRIGMVKGTSAQYFLDAYLLFNGIEPARVTLVPLAPEQVPQALARREVDVVAIWEPFAYLAKTLLGADAMVMDSPRIYTETFNLVVLRSLAAAREADLVKMLRAIERAQQFIRQQPGQAQAILKERIHVDQGFIDATWGDFDYRLGLDQSLVSTLEGQARWAQREGHVQADLKPPTFLEFVQSAALRQAAPASVNTVTPPGKR